jgi:hypothetical protein
MAGWGGTATMSQPRARITARKTNNILVTAHLLELGLAIAKGKAWPEFLGAVRRKAVTWVASAQAGEHLWSSIEAGQRPGYRGPSKREQICGNQIRVPQNKATTSVHICQIWGETRVKPVECNSKTDYKYSFTFRARERVKAPPLPFLS